MELELQFGASAPTISRQIGKELNNPEISWPDFDKDADAITRLHVREIISDSESQKARKRLMKKIVPHVQAWKLRTETGLE